MNALRRLRSRRGADAGFTLIEVMVAMALLLIVSTASMFLTVVGLRTSGYEQHRQVAVTLASSAIEKATALGSSSTLTSGRGSAAVAAAFSAVSSAAGVSQTYPVWDLTAAPNGNGALPIVTTDMLQGTTFTTYLIVGDCFRPSNATTGVSCGKPGAFGDVEPTPGQASGAGLVREIRVIAVVTWTADQTCSTGGCSTQSSTMVDPNQDLSWLG